ncbi:hypothetical protein COO60DRAFT_1639199 [Scenedesmus sp. NREL 46B-D3]|nr:hypothetical protein COO60DRAFT_1639199 [Scenedesmus sp. NREL 46B-D3]
MRRQAGGSEIVSGQGSRGAVTAIFQHPPEMYPGSDLMVALPAYSVPVVGLSMLSLLPAGANPIIIIWGGPGCGKSTAGRLAADGTGMMLSDICTGATSDAAMLNLASTCKGGVVIIDDGTASIGSHTKGGLMKHFTDHLHSSTVSGGQRCPKDVENVAQRLRERCPELLNRVAINIAGYTVCVVALVRSSLGEALATQLMSYRLNVWAPHCQVLLESLTPKGALLCALQALVDSTVTVELPSQQQVQLPRIVAAGGRLALDDDGPSRKAVLLSYPGLAESYKAATGSECLISKSELSAGA